MGQVTNKLGLDLIKSFEGLKLKAYKLAGESYYTIGYGHSFDKSITADTVWTDDQADDALKKDLKRFEDYVTKYAKQYGLKFNDNQFSALVSYCYNRGPGGLNQLLSHSKNVADVANNIVIYWGSAAKYKVGLIRRRKEERELFVKAVPKPKPVKSIDQLAKDVIAGKLGDGDARKKALGKNYDAVQKRVGELVNPPKKLKTKSVHDLALEVIEGVHGNGDKRKKSLGKNYDAVQKDVAHILNK